MKFRMLASMAAIVTLSSGCGEDPQAPASNPIRDSAEFVQKLASAYRARHYAAFAALLGDDFRFVFPDPIPTPAANLWDRDTELLAHRRMFNPARIPAHEPPLDDALWLQSVAITLTPSTTFDERTDLYTTAVPPGPLDPARWIAREVICSDDAFFQLQGETDFVVHGQSKFVIVEDRTKQVGAAGKFLLYSWEELGSPAKALGIEEISWESFKRLFL